MYAISGVISIIWQLLLTIGIFLLTILGKIILLVSVSCYAIIHPRNEIQFEMPPFETMYPECIEFEEICETHSSVSLETFSSYDSSNRSNLLFPDEEIEFKENNYLNLMQINMRKKTACKLTNTHIQTLEASVNTDCNSKTCLTNK